MINFDEVTTIEIQHGHTTKNSSLMIPTIFANYKQLDD